MANRLIFLLGKMIGIDDDYLKKLDEEYSTANEMRKFDIMNILWKHFFKLIDEIANIKYQQFLAEVALGKRRLTKDLYQQAVLAAKEHLFRRLIGDTDDEREIEEIRKTLFDAFDRRES